MLLMQEGFVEGDIENLTILINHNALCKGGCARASFDVYSQLACVKDYT